MKRKIYTIDQFRTWGRQGGKKSAATNSIRMKLFWAAKKAKKDIHNIIALDS